MRDLDFEGLQGIQDKAKKMTVSDKLLEQDLLQERVLLLLFSGVSQMTVQKLLKDAVVKFHEIKWTNPQSDIF